MCPCVTRRSHGNHVTAFVVDAPNAIKARNASLHEPSPSSLAAMPEMGVLFFFYLEMCYVLHKLGHIMRGKKKRTVPYKDTAEWGTNLLTLHCIPGNADIYYRYIGFLPRMLRRLSRSACFCSSSPAQFGPPPPLSLASHRRSVPSERDHGTVSEVYTTLLQRYSNR